MAGRYQPDQRLELVVAGVASAGLEWRGGEGVAIAYGTVPSGGISLQMSPDNGTTWVNFHIYGAADGQHVEWASATPDAKNFVLPACRIRASAGGGATLNILAVSV